MSYLGTEFSAVLILSANMIKLLSLEFLVLSHRMPGKIKNAFYRLQIFVLVPEIFELEKCVKYANSANKRTDDVIQSTQKIIKYI